MARPRSYPPKAELRRVIREICSVNSFNVEEVMGGGADSDCCVVERLPKRPARGRVNMGRYFFGQEDPGYVIVSPRSSAAVKVWPFTPHGVHPPVRLQRWLVMARQGEHAAHSCDNPACVNVGHLRRATAASNLKDAHDRNRRSKAPCAAVSTPRVVPPPRLPAAPLSHRRADKVFCVTGFHSPSKLARMRARLAGGTGRKLQLQACLPSPPPPPPPRPIPPLAPPPRRNSIDDPAQHPHLAAPSQADIQCQHRIPGHCLQLRRGFGSRMAPSCDSTAQPTPRQSSARSRPP